MNEGDIKWLYKIGSRGSSNKIYWYCIRTPVFSNDYSFSFIILSWYDMKIVMLRGMHTVQAKI